LPSNSPPPGLTEALGDAWVTVGPGAGGAPSSSLGPGMNPTAVATMKDSSAEARRPAGRLLVSTAELKMDTAASRSLVAATGTASLLPDTRRVKADAGA
jgi:hypothetical protein